MTDAFDCQTCGACCRTVLWSVSVEPHDPTPKTATLSVRGKMEFTRFDAEMGMRMMKSTNDVCASLCGKLRSKVSCGIYDKRPSSCRDFVPGSGDCLFARSSIGL